MKFRENSRIDSIVNKRYEKDSVMTKTREEKEYELMIKKEIDLIKREDKLQNVERISKATNYKKDKLL